VNAALRLVPACEPATADLLAASVAIVAAVDAIDVLEGHVACGWNEQCECDALLVERAEVLEVPGLGRFCSRECTANALLWQHSASQDQSARARDWVLAVIERSFAAARSRVGGA
jgi:hypothetical protein